MWSLLALVIGFIMDLIIGDPHRILHPVVIIGKEISFLERVLRRIFPSVSRGERIAGTVLWFTVSISALLIPILVLLVCHCINPWLRVLAESIMCWQCLAVKSLKDESMKVFYALQSGDISKARYAVSMIVGRDTERLDEAGICRAAVETVAENISDGVIAPMFYLIIGGGPLGFLYKAVNTMDSMLGYIDPPYKYFGWFSAKADDTANFIPSRLSAAFMLAAGGVLNLNVKNGVKIFRRDRFNHASPNSAQTESVCAGLFGIRLAGDAWYHGILHKKKYIGDELRRIEHEDIPRICRLLYVTAALAWAVFCMIKLFVLL